MTTPSISGQPEDRKAGVLELVSSGTSIAGVALAIAGGVMVSPLLITLGAAGGAIALATKVASRHARSSNSSD